MPDVDDDDLKPIVQKSVWQEPRTELSFVSKPLIVTELFSSPE